MRFSPLLKASWTGASCVEGVPLIAASAEPFVFFAGRPATEWATDARAGCVPLSLNVVVGRNGGSISRWTHAFLPFLEGHSFGVSYQTHRQERTEKHIKCQAKPRPPVRHAGVVDEEMMHEIKNTVPDKGSDD